MVRMLEKVIENRKFNSHYNQRKLKYNNNHVGAVTILENFVVYKFLATSVPLEKNLEQLVKENAL